LEEVVSFAREHGLVVAYDNAYSEMYFDEPPLSFLRFPAPKKSALNSIRFPRRST